MMLPRLIGPREQLERDGDESLGFISPAHLDRRTDRAIKQDGDPARNQLIVAQETIVTHRADVAANASTTMLLVIPTSGTAFAATGVSLYVPSPARVLVARIHGNADVTAGTVMPELQITEGGDVTTVTFDEAELNTTYPRSKAVAYEWEQAPQIAGESTIVMRAKADSAYLPVTNDLTITFVLGYSSWT